jgi:hypothetical protein
MSQDSFKGRDGDEKFEMNKGKLKIEKSDETETAGESENRMFVRRKAAHTVKNFPNGERK